MRCSTRSPRRPGSPSGSAWRAVAASCAAGAVLVEGGARAALDAAAAGYERVGHMFWACRAAATGWHTVTVA